MKNLIIILLFTPLWVSGQFMTWVPADKVETSECVNLTDCENNIVCYQLQYTPNKDGVITSYTTGFFAECDEGGTSVLSNQSCLIADNSQQLVACESHSRVLFNASGNSGNVQSSCIKKGEPVFLHQVCFKLKSKKEVRILRDAITNLTVSIDLENTEESITEFPSYRSYIVQNDDICNALESADDIVLKINSPENRITSLDWSIASETGIGSYIVERSINGAGFINIAEINDQSYNESTMRYTFIDEYAEVGNNTYRISYRNGAKNIEQSNEESIEYLSESEEFRVFPNPAVNEVNILSYFTEDSYNLTITDPNGMVIQRRKISERGLLQLNVDDFLSGTYKFLIETSKNYYDHSIIVLK